MSGVGLLSDINIAYLRSTQFLRNKNLKKKLMFSQTYAATFQELKQTADLKADFLLP